MSVAVCVHLSVTVPMIELWTVSGTVYETVFETVSATVSVVHNYAGHLVGTSSKKIAEEELNGGGGELQG